MKSRDPFLDKDGSKSPRDKNKFAHKDSPRNKKYHVAPCVPEKIKLDAITWLV